MPATGSRQQDRIPLKQFLADRCGLNALHQYPCRFQVVCRHAELDDTLKSRQQASETVLASSSDIRLALPKRRHCNVVVSVRIDCASPSALITATAHMLLFSTMPAHRPRPPDRVPNPAQPRRTCPADDSETRSFRGC